MPTDSSKAEAEQDGKHALRLAEVQEVAREKPELEKHEALHQVARDVELPIHERRRAVGERRGDKNDRREHDQDAAE